MRQRKIALCVVLILLVALASLLVASPAKSSQAAYTVNLPLVLKGTAGGEWVHVFHSYAFLDLGYYDGYNCYVEFPDTGEGDFEYRAVMTFTPGAHNTAEAVRGKLELHGWDWPWLEVHFVELPINYSGSVNLDTRWGGYGTFSLENRTSDSRLQGSLGMAIDRWESD